MRKPDASDPTWSDCGGGNSAILPSASATEASSSSGESGGGNHDDYEEEEVDVNDGGRIMPNFSKDSTAMSIPDISSPQNSPFRRSLDEEHRAKELSRKKLLQGRGGGGGARHLFTASSSSSAAVPVAESTTTRINEVDEEGGERNAVDPKQLLRQSINSLSNSAIPGGGVGNGGGAEKEEVLTLPERNFLEMLLESNDPGIDDACMAARERLLDVNLFSWGSCGGGDEVLPRRLISENLRQDSADWARGEWVDRNDDAKDSDSPAPNDLDHSTSPAAEDTLNRPYDLRRRSSEARLIRLLMRKSQSSLGKDNNRLFRAHEAGLIVTPTGSARRSLMKMGMKMGLPMMEKVHYIPNPPLPANDADDDGEREGAPVDDPNIAATALSGILRNTNKGGTCDKTTFEKALAKMDERTIRRIEKEGQKALAKVDERTIRRIEKEERAKDRQLSMTQMPMAGCSSPFSINVLRAMFASKQMTFRQSSSSYSRFDSFLTSTEKSEPGILTTDSSLVPENDKKNDIFRPNQKPSTSKERFENLLINAGFKDEADDGYNDDLVDANTEDDNEILTSPSNQSVAILTKGGPSYRDVNMFRESPPVKMKPGESGIEKGKSKIECQFPDKVKESTSDEAKVSPATSDIGELPSALSKSLPSGLSNSLPLLPPLGKPSISTQLHSSTTSSRERSNTAGIIKRTSSTSMSPSRKGRYSRSVSWGHMVFSKDEGKAVMARQASSASITSESGLSILSFPHLRKASPLRSDSLRSITSNSVSLQPLRLGAPLRSDSTYSNSSMSIPMLGRAYPISSPMSSYIPLPPATAVRSDSQATMGTNIDDEGSLNSVDFVAANPNIPIHSTSTTDSVSGREFGVFIRQASRNCYEGMGMEVEDLPQLDSIDNARKYKSMVSVDYSVHSSRSARSFSRQRSSSIPTNLPIVALDDSFIIKNIDIERRAAEILRSLSNEDLCSSHRLETINGGSSKGRKFNESSSTTRVNGDLLSDDGSWDMETSSSFGAANAWGVLDDEYAEGVHFQILGTSANDSNCHPHVLSPPLMESLQNFFPSSVSDNNFWLKYSLVRDGASLPSLLRHIRGAKHTLIAIETVEGEVFGSFTSSPWRRNWNYYGNGESFLWRMRRSRSEKDAQYSILDQAKLESELDVFHWSGLNDLVQYCSHDMIAIGGGALPEDNSDNKPDEQRELPPQNPAFTKANEGGFGLAIDSDLLRGTSSSCATFQSPPLSKAHPNGPFEILNMEVWTLTPCINIREAENLEMRTLFLNGYNRDL
ncbi:hypothetical protein ACHAXA_010688 [Cyclostephanos tholiformis]|uniref:Oxidation resistance protein 1 n=1 Tax=Cyclostephanos tholiformis TaxID=382380 RepID=A0ABD3SED4_9STRA